MSNPPPPPPGDFSHPSEPQQPDPNPAEPIEGYSALPYPAPAQPPSYDQGHPQLQSGPPPYEQGGQQFAQRDQQHVGQPGVAASTMTESEEKTWSILAHLSAPIAALASVGLLNFVGPLIIWAIYKDKSQRVRHAAAGAFNFNLSLWLFYAALIAVSVITAILTLGLALFITIPLGVVVWVASMIIHVMAAIKANNGEVYTYPLQIPILK